MNTVVVTTTIGVPEVLREYRELDDEVVFIIAGDRKTPHAELERLSRELKPCAYLHPDYQELTYPELSAAIGWDCIQRRNIAILEAAKLGPDVIVSIDDDNHPRGAYFTELEHAFAGGDRLASGEWLNIGGFAREAYTYRGMPYTARAANELNGIADGRVGICNGLVYGDPDINATERLEADPIVRSYQREATEGISIDPGETWSPVNSQNTGWLAELAPLMLLPPDVGRYDDIWGSYIAQAVIGSRYLIHFGAPFVTQERNDHDVFRDLELELYGMRQTEAFVARLKGAELTGTTILERLGELLEGLGNVPTLPHDFFRAWLAAWRQ